YAEGTTSWMKAGELANLAAGKETDWLDQVTRTGKIQNYQIAVSGAGENVNYYLSASYDKNKSIVVGDDFNRISLLGKVDTKITSWLEIGIDGSFSRRDYSGVAANIGEAQMESPYGVEYRDSLGHLEKYPYTQSSINPLWGVNDGTRDNSDIRRNFRLNSYAVVKIPWIEGLSYRLNYLNNLDKVEQGNFYHEGYFVKEGAGLDRYTQSTIQGFLTNANGNLYNTTTTSYVIDNILNYKHSFSKHNVEVTLVATRDYSKYTAMNMTGSDFASNGNTSLGMWGLHKATVQKFDLNGTKTTNIGYLGRLTYSFNDKYFLTGSFRRDGASVFGANKKWGNFAAAGAAWKISNEEFLKGFDPLSSLKLKLSWGQNGSQGISPYGTLSTVSNGASGAIDYEFSSAQGTIVYGLNQTTLGNADLAWEKTETWNTGFESSWLKDRLFVDMDLYLSKTRDQHFTRNIPVMTGFKTIQTAMGQVNNSGIELDIKSVNVQNKDWTWNTGITFWKNNNKLVKLYGQDLNGDGKEDDDISNGLFVGKSLGAIYGYEQDGIVQTTDADYIALTGAAPGAPKYKDIDGVAGITSADRKILGYTKENFRMGMSNEISYKNFDLYVMVAGVFGGNNHYLKSNTSAFMTSGTGRFNDNTISKPYWTPENPSNKYPSAYFSGDSRYQALQSRGFVRVQDVTLTYTLQKNWIQKAHINNMKIFISAKNLATFTNWVGGDPEVGTTVRENTLPVPSTYTIGANLSF
ncbi:MAG: SusC/RagA family TonB-linked outer membrane protein, partial [Bacteroidota bacterium]|nr:SusC/RagA family TonB-linked outer membrane protein [Bacteroidota bacterium]